MAYLTTRWLTNETLEKMIRDYRKELDRLESKRENIEPSYEGEVDRLDEIIESCKSGITEMKAELEQRA